MCVCERREEREREICFDAYLCHHAVALTDFENAVIFLCCYLVARLYSVRRLF